MLQQSIIYKRLRLISPLLKITVSCFFFLLWSLNKCPSAVLMLQHSLAQSSLVQKWMTQSKLDCKLCWQLVLHKYFKWTVGWSVRFKYFSGICSLTGFQLCWAAHTLYSKAGVCRCSQLGSRPITSYYAKLRLSTRIPRLGLGGLAARRQGYLYPEAKLHRD